MKYILLIILLSISANARNFQLIKYDSTYSGEIEWFLNNTSSNMYFGTNDADSVGLFPLELGGGGVIEDSLGLNITRRLNYIGNTATATDIDFAILPRGAGAFQLSLNDSSITGGLKRGLYANDLQRHRDSITQVAIGLYGFIGNGRSNAVNGAYNSILNGYNNIILDSTANNTILGGYNNSILRNSYNNTVNGDTNSITHSIYNYINGLHNNIEYGSNYNIMNGQENSLEQNSVYNIVNGLEDTLFSSNSNIINGQRNLSQHSIGTIINGNDNEAFATTSVIITGQNNNADSLYNSVVAGSYAVPKYNNSYHLGGGIEQGQHQFSIVILSGESTADFYNELYINGVAPQRLLIDSNSVYMIRFDIVGTSLQAGSQGWLNATMHVHRAGNVSTTTCDNPIDTTINADPVIMSVRSNADIVNGALRVEVRNMGATANWTVVAYITKSTY